MARYRIVLDSGALSAVAENPQKYETIRATLKKGLELRAFLAVPTVVVAESTTGDLPRDAHVNRALKAFEVVGLDESLARSSARLRYAARRSAADTIDAIVVATADALPGTILITTDPKDIRPLAAVRGITRVIAAAVR